MSTFEFISVALSFVLGLGVTQLLSAMVRVFLMRKKMRIDWIPMVWAVSIFLAMIQFWWAIYELSVLEEWRLTHFLFCLVMVLLLFVAGALVLPMPVIGEASDLGHVFEEHGRFGLIGLSTYSLTALVGNFWFFSSSPTSLIGLLNSALAVVPIVVVATRNRSIRSAATLAYLALMLVAAYQASPASY